MKKTTKSKAQKKERGVSKRTSGMWESYIFSKGRKINLGLYKTKTEALKANQEATILLLAVEAVNTFNQGKKTTTSKKKRVSNENMD